MPVTDRAWRSWIRTWGLALVPLLGMAACSGGGETSSTSTLRDGGADATAASLACTTNTDCAKKLPTTTPAGCAIATCNTLQGVCVFAAQDQDGDGHPAASCKSNVPSVNITTGDDCNDQDPDLYPGHPKACSAATDGGASGGTVCVQGQVSCQSDGTESACTGTVACVDQTCVSGGCVGVCAPGQSQCSGQQPQSCDGQGRWVDQGAACSSTQTCTGGVGSDAGGQAACGGSCSPGTMTCSGAQPLVCAGGAWVNSGAACSGSSAACYMGVCRLCMPSSVGCSGNQPQVCDAAGDAWQNSGAACAGACLAGACVACAPGTTQCSSATQPQVCSSVGSWQDETACASQTCVGGGQAADAGAATCTGVCGPGQTHCASVTQPQTCSVLGAWQNATACAAGEPCCNGGCIVDDMNNCGSCGRTCSVPSGHTGFCASGLCGVTFVYTGASQTFTVPAGVTQVTLHAAGAAGGHGAINADGGYNASGGNGASVAATIGVTPGEVLTILVGGAGGDLSAEGPGGFNGGGPSVTCSVPLDAGSIRYGAGGGGASDVRQGGSGLANRVVIAGGGGGADTTQSGGAGGAPNGVDGAGSPGGGGGTQSGGGAGNSTFGSTSGTSGAGGAGWGTVCTSGVVLSGVVPIGGGGGGGYYGGGGGNTGGGGGGSSYVEPSATSATMTAGTQTGNGVVTIAY